MMLGSVFSDVDDGLCLDSNLVLLFSRFCRLLL